MNSFISNFITIYLLMYCNWRLDNDIVITENVLTNNIHGETQH